MSELRSYQHEGIAFLAKARRAILGDEMRLGKTVQALEAAAELGADQILVVAPKTAAGVWVEEAMKWLGMPREAIASYNGHGRTWPTDAKLVITNYKLIGEVAEHQRTWDVIIFDEAHKLRNARVRKAKVVNGERVERGPWRDVHKLIAAEGLFFLTGTPVTKNAGDLFPLLNMIEPRRFSSYWAFVKRWAITYHNGFGYVVEGSRDEAKLRAELASIMLRRTQAEVRPELPATARQLVPVELSTKQARHYTELEKDLMTQIGDEILTAPGVLAKFTRLRQLLACPRVLGIDDDGAALEGLVEELAGADTPALVFTPFAEAIPHIGAALEKAGIETVAVHGQMTARQLAANVAWFQDSDNPARALVATTQQGTAWAGNAATITYFLGYMWNPSDNIQAEARMGGQERPTFARYFRYTNSIDDHMLDILTGKTMTARRILGHETVASSAARS